MKAYPAYKTTNSAWIGSIPVHWTINRFKHIFNIKKNIAGELGFDILSITQKGIKVKNIESGEGQISSDYSKYQHVSIGDFAMNHMDLLTGFVDLSKFEGVTSPDYRVFALRDKNSEPNFYLYLLQLCYYHKIFYPFGQGAAHIGRWRLPTEAFKDFYAPTPPFEEQSKIAHYLDAKLKQIDDLIIEKNNFLELLKEKRHSLVDTAIKHTNTKYLTIDHVTKRILRPVEIIEDKKYTAIGLYNRGRGIFHKKQKLGKDLGDSDFYHVKSGDLILSGQFAWEGSVAIAIESENECICSHRYPIFRGKDSILNTNYFWAFLTTNEGDFILNEHSVGAAGRNRPLNTNSLRKNKIPVPPFNLQLEISSLVEKEREMKLAIQNSKARLIDRKISLIYEVISGKIDIRDEV